MSLTDVNSEPAAGDLHPNLIRRYHLIDTCPPISDVPHELLSNIFKYVIAMDQSSFLYILGSDLLILGLVSEADVREAYTQARAVVRIAHVCRYWRQVALETPFLWTRIDGRRSERLCMFKEHSQDLPVSLYLKADVSNLANSLNAAPAERLRRLDLELDTLERHMHVEPLTTWAPPNLKCLTTIADGEYYTGTIRRPLARVQLLGGHTDALKALALQFLGSWVPSNAFPSLTHLHLSFACSTDVETSDVRVVLANAPRLEFVFLAHLLYRSEPGPFHHAPIVLNRLRSLSLVRSAYTSSTSLMQSLSVPDHCFVRLSALHSNRSRNGGEPPPLADAGPLHHPTKLDIAYTQFHMLLVADSETSGYWVQAYRDVLDSWELWFHDLPAMMTLSTVTSLHINIDCAHTFWSSVLRHMTAVTELKAVICETLSDRPLPIDIFCALLSEEPVLLPSLCDLFVQGIHDHRTLTTLASESGGFVDMVIYRSRAGHRLRRLVVQPDFKSHTAVHNLFGSRIAELAENVDAFRMVGFGSPLCKYDMRDVWRIEEENKYWKPRKSDRASYVLPRRSYWMY
ncbi:hypothetical protein C8T65DRAFT_642340 [Cerioporus squamosus]|nr:hypothetical protein C8T65DRAFT_642340 [Cerioporus squamosus]